LKDLKPNEVPALDYRTLKYHVQDLADLFKKGSFMEQKSFLQSLIKRIQVNAKIVIDYTIPLNPLEKALAASKSLPIGPNGEAICSIGKFFRILFRIQRKKKKQCGVCSTYCKITYLR